MHACRRFEPTDTNLYQNTQAQAVAPAPRGRNTHPRMDTGENIVPLLGQTHVRDALARKHTKKRGAPVETTATLALKT